MRLRIGAAALCMALLLGCGAVFGKTGLSDPRSTWRVGVATFTAEGLTPENAYLRASYPLLLREILGRLDEHRYTDEEMLAYRLLIVARERDRLLKLRDAALASRDTEIISGKLSSESAGGKRADELLESIKKLDGLDPEDIGIAEKKPVELASAAESPLLPAVTGSVAGYAQKYNLDLLVFGTIEEIESYLFVDVYLYFDASGERNVLKTAFSRERLAEGSQTVFDSLAGAVLGRDWADITITASEESAEVYVDGQFKGIGEVTLNYLETGEHTVVVKAVGYGEYEETFLISAGETAFLSAELVPEVPRTVTLSSAPSGAGLYARSQWYGTTPVDVHGDLVDLQGTLRKEGYQDALVPGIPGNADSLEITLMPDVLDRRTVIKDEREGFYKVLAAFILSVPLPVYFFDFTNTLTQSYMTEAQLPPYQRNLDEVYRLFELRQLSLSAYVATAFVSVALFIDATRELLEYIDRVQLTTY
ncbi:MAG: PEGA domain-containing protein [Spirochaetales bacterium]|nr:PEGA domain-containing protein [Spirochaetales bacterium]